MRSSNISLRIAEAFSGCGLASRMRTPIRDQARSYMIP
ncbi:hypothetical protein VDG1235_2358 [Verrucomicrobiia bacterium DG1235]|nr:hypothetical protein VDG1235_2358 [Verrucomicrobiae bacterium DG1235]